MLGDYFLMVDLKKTILRKDEKILLMNPKVGGVILFARNFQDEKQLRQLITSIRELDRPRLLIAVDQEGGRVQRFKTAPFTMLPPMAKLGALFDENPQLARRAARALGGVLGHELKFFDIDLTFAPVLDLDYGASSVIGNRAFHRNPKVVVALAKAFLKGLTTAGVAHCGKHFPGHGFVSADSHTDLPIDERVFAEMQDDFYPYEHLHLKAVMAAHVIYKTLDDETAVFSKTWMEKLRRDFRFKGAIFTDDLSMQGAKEKAANIVQRVEKAWAAGCDMALICNDLNSALIAVDRWKPKFRNDNAARMKRLKNLFLIKNDSGKEYEKQRRFLKTHGLII